MFIPFDTLLASFSLPYEIGNGIGALLWILPLLAAVAIVWKTLKLETITPAKLIRQVVILFFTMVVCYAAIAVALYVIGRLVLS